MRIGIAGFGRMGAAMAERICSQGHRVAVWNRSPDPLAAARTLGVDVCPTLTDLLLQSDIVISSLFDEAAVRAVYLGDGGFAQMALDGKLLIETSTIGPEMGSELGRAIAAAGGRFVDSPVLGTVGPAREGQLIALVGGDPASIVDANEILQLLSRAVYPLGPAGAGYAGKLAINLVKATYYAALGDCLGLARRFGIQPDAILDVIETGPGALVELPGKMPVLRGADVKAGFVIRGVLKDLEAMILAGGGSEAVPVAAGAMKAVSRAVDGGWGERDVAMIAHYSAHVFGAGKADAETPTAVNS